MHLASLLRIDARIEPDRTHGGLTSSHTGRPISCAIQHIECLRLGFTAVTASNGRDALRLLLEDELHPDLILLDLMMPVMDGRAFRAEQAKNLRLDSIPVVLFSAYALQPDDVERLKVAGFLKKPMSLRALLDTVERFATAGSGDEAATGRQRLR